MLLGLPTYLFPEVFIQNFACFSYLFHTQCFSPLPHCPLFLPSTSCYVPLSYDNISKLNQCKLIYIIIGVCISVFLFLDTKREILNIRTKSLRHNFFLFLVSSGVIFPHFNSPLVSYLVRHIFKSLCRELTEYASHTTQALF